MTDAYPLEDAERVALVRVLAMNEAVVLAFAVLLSMFLSCLRAGNVLPVLGIGWLADIFAEFTFEPVVVAAGAIVALASQLLESIPVEHSPSRQRAVDESRQGISGELIRLPLPVIVGFMLVVGVAEELLFRYAAIGLFAWVLGAFVPVRPATVIALTGATVFFTSIHVQYKNLWNVAAVGVVGLLLGVAYLLTGSLLSVMLAHALYDIVELLAQRWRMTREEGYFKGKVPNGIAREMLARSGEGEAAE